MKAMIKIVLAATVAVSGLSAATSANAALVFNVTEVGANVVAAGSGAIATAGLTPSISEAYTPLINGSAGAVLVGVNGVDSTRYFNSFINPQSFGTVDHYSISSTGSGSNFGIYGSQLFNSIFLPVGYLSGTALTGTTTYNGATLASMGLTSGSYVFNLTNGDRVTVNIGSAVPEPATWALMLAGFGMVGFGLRRRNAKPTVSFA